MSEHELDEMPAERAIEIANLWRAGKMIGYDPGDVAIALLKEVERQAAELAALRGFAESMHVYVCEKRLAYGGIEFELKNYKLIDETGNPTPLLTGNIK